jgi:tRNA (cytidine/uridine-2'-O-)-methyltransferase
VRQASCRLRRLRISERIFGSVCDQSRRDGHQPARAREHLTVATHVVLVHPEIHWNTGNVGRTCLAAGATLHLIEPLGFSLDEREVKRAGLDYWEHVDLRVWPSWEAFESELATLGDPYFFSTKATPLFWDAPFAESNDVVLIFGRETGGLPPELHERYRDRFVTMPMLSPRVRSLNLSTSVGIAIYEVLRQRWRADR